MNLKNVITITSCVLLVACSNPNVRREDMIAEFPGWNNVTKNLVRDGKIIKGMNRDHVRAAWGSPCWECTGTKTASWGESWEYITQTVFFDNSGQVSRWVNN